MDGGTSCRNGSPNSFSVSNSEDIAISWVRGVFLTLKTMPKRAKIKSSVVVFGRGLLKESGSRSASRAKWGERESNPHGLSA